MLYKKLVKDKNASLCENFSGKRMQGLGTLQGYHGPELETILVST
jgi:hypothetical protein